MIEEKTTVKTDCPRPRLGPRPTLPTGGRTTYALCCARSGLKLSTGQFARRPLPQGQAWPYTSVSLNTRYVRVSDRSALKPSPRRFPRRASPSPTGRAHFMPPPCYRIPTGSIVPLERLQDGLRPEVVRAPYQLCRGAAPSTASSACRFRSSFKGFSNKTSFTQPLTPPKAPRSPMQRSHRPRRNPLSWATRPLLWTVSRQSLPVRPWRSLHPCNL